MTLDHEAIYKVYSDCVRIDDSVGAFKEDGTQITLVQSDIDAARVTLNAEYAALDYSRKRVEKYPSFSEYISNIAFAPSTSARRISFLTNSPLLM